MIKIRCEKKNAEMQTHKVYGKVFNQYSRASVNFIFN